MMMKRGVSSILLALLMFAANQSNAQTPFLKSHNLFRGKEEYTVNVIYQDPKGLIWFGTDRGLFMSDGINDTWYTTAEGLSDNNVISLHTTKNDVLWIGHRNGRITRFYNDTFSPFNPEEGLGTVPVTDIVSDTTGIIWYSTDGEGLYRWDGTHLANFDSKDGLAGDEVYDIEICDHGAIWLATFSGITKYSGGTFETISTSDGLPDNYVRVLKSANDGRLWIGTDEKGVSVYSPTDRTFINSADWEDGPVTGLAIGTDKDVWVSTERNGVIQLRYDEGRKPLRRTIKVSQSTSAQKINSVIKDLEDNIWVGGPKLVTQIFPPLFEFLNPSVGTPFELCSSITEDNAGNLWVCTEKGLFRGKPGSPSSIEWTSISRLTGHSNTNFISLYTDSQGKIWAGTYGEGVLRIDPVTLSFSKYTTAQGLTDNNIVSISGKDDHVWFSTLGGGISYFNLKTSQVKSYNYSELRESYIYSTKSDRFGKTWIAGSLRYPAYISGDSLYLLNKPGQRVPQIYGIAIDSSGNPWFNTRDKGLIILKGDSTRLLGKADGITFDKIQSLVFDKNNNLVIISNRGFLFYRPGEGVLLEYGENTGLSYLYPVDNAVYTDKSGQVWIGTETGIIRYNPDYLFPEKSTPRVFISTRKQNYNTVPATRKRFSFKENNFTFGFTGIWFTNPEGLKFRYMLKGNDPGWSFTNRSQTRTYSRLSSGSYTFIAEVSLDEKTWYSSPESSYSFRVLPPFYLRWWFITLMIVLTVSGVYSYIRLRLKKLERDKERLELEVQKRTEEVRRQNQELEEQKKEIEHQRDIAEEQRDKIEAQKEEIQSSIRYAQRIQTATLPPNKQLSDILGNYFILNKPRDIVSGDFYWVARNGSFIFFAAGDCTGHGVPGSFMSMLGLSALNDIAKSLKVCKASVILDQLRDRIQEALHQGGEREMVSHDGMDISLCILDRNTNKLQFAAAHNPLYIIRNGEISVINPDKIDIGNFSVEKQEFTNNELQCEPGDLIYLFTDGYADQFGGPKGKKYKYQQFKDFLLKIHKEDLQKQRELLDTEIESWRGTRPQVDDILVMGIGI